MFEITKEKEILCTRGDVGVFSVSATVDGVKQQFQIGDAIRFRVFEKKNCEEVAIEKFISIDVHNLSEDATAVTINLTETDTRIGEIINKPVDYWYEIEHIDAGGNVRTIVGYDDDGAKIFRLYPEGKEKSNPVMPRDIPVIDKELDTESCRPVENQAVARAVLRLEEMIKELSDKVDSIN